MSDRSFWSYLLYWRTKTPQDNQWRPVPGSDSQLTPSMPLWFRRWDPEAAVVDCAPMVLAAGCSTYMSQARDFGFTATANVFKNKPTIAAMAVASSITMPLCMIFQIAGFEYRYYIPRWANERDLRRDNDEVREHVNYGMMAGFSTVLLRIHPAFVLTNMTLGGGLADLLLREYVRAHSM